MGAINLLIEAKNAGLEVFPDGQKLVVRGPRNLEPLARKILAHKPDVLTALWWSELESVRFGKVTPIDRSTWAAGMLDRMESLDIYWMVPTAELVWLESWERGDIDRPAPRRKAAPARITPRYSIRYELAEPWAAEVREAMDGAEWFTTWSQQCQARWAASMESLAAELALPTRRTARIFIRNLADKYRE